MQNFYETSCSDFDTYIKYQQNKENRHKKNEYKKFKTSVYTVTSIILILTVMLVSSIIIAGALFVRNSALNDEISLQTESYRKAVDYYETLNAYTADNAVNDFIDELTGGILSTDPNSFTKSKLKLFIIEVEDYISNFDSLGLSKTHPEIYESLTKKLNDSKAALENETYMYPYSDADYILGCNLVKREQGANISPDEAQMLVMCVALNRKQYGTLYASNAKDPNNPTLLEVITQPGQYGEGYSYHMSLDGVTDKVKENVRKVFEHEFECPDNVLFQTTIYYSNKTIYKSFANPAPYNNHTYFYYGRTS